MFIVRVLNLDRWTAEYLGAANMLSVSTCLGCKWLFVVVGMHA